MPGLNTISPKNLMRLIGTPSAPCILDVCLEDDFQNDPRLIPTARRCHHNNILELAPDLRGKPVVVSCLKGKKLSQGAAAMLRTADITAEALEGGNIAWKAANYPIIPLQMAQQDLWVTRHRPKIDRIACPWLIRRFVNPDARFLYVAPDEVGEVADKFGGIAFDMPGGDWSHDGDLCTFDTMLARFGLETEPLQTLAKVIRGADTNRHDLAPEAAGLLAFSVGLSRAWKDDLEQLDQAMPLYDALYRWARDGQDEGHDWPPRAST